MKILYQNSTQVKSFSRISVPREIIRRVPRPYLRHFFVWAVARTLYKELPSLYKASQELAPIFEVHWRTIYKILKIKEVPLDALGKIPEDTLVLYEGTKICSGPGRDPITIPDAVKDFRLFTAWAGAVRVSGSRKQFMKARSWWADALGVSDRTVDKDVALLKEAGLIDVERTVELCIVNETLGRSAMGIDKRRYIKDTPFINGMNIYKHRSAGFIDYDRNENFRAGAGDIARPGEAVILDETKRKRTFVWGIDDDQAQEQLYSNDIYVIMPILYEDRRVVLRVKSLTEWSHVLHVVAKYTTCYQKLQGSYINSAQYIRQGLYGEFPEYLRKSFSISKMNANQDYSCFMKLGVVDETPVYRKAVPTYEESCKLDELRKKNREGEGSGPPFPQDSRAKSHWTIRVFASQ